jgi:hypothetical protein
MKQPSAPSAGHAPTGQAQAENWQLPEDRGLIEQEVIARILAGEDYPETTSYSREIEYIDFESYGQPFTQVVVTLTPREPRMHQGRELVVVGGEPGSEYALDFIATVEGREGPAVWLAKRGIKFVALTRVGRWNFFDKGGLGAWSAIPLEQRMPIFSRQQKAPWTEADFEARRAAAKAADSGDSDIYRFPKQESPLYNQMLAATPQTFLSGYRRALEHVLPPAQRDRSFVLFWGMSTGGAFLYPLAAHFLPDGYLGWGTSSTGIAYSYRKATQGNFAIPYANTALRLRERGFDDFVLYTQEIDESTRARWWERALKGPRFKSGEDMGMQFNVAALTETALKLWLSDFLPADYRQKGLGEFIKAELEPSFPPAQLKHVNTLELNGTCDEAIPPKSAQAHREVMEPYARKYRSASVQGLHHYLFTQQSIKVVGSLWLRYIDSGYFEEPV